MFTGEPQRRLLGHHWYHPVCGGVTVGVLIATAHHPWFRFLASFALGQEASLGASRAFTPSRAVATLTVEYE